MARLFQYVVNHTHLLFSGLLTLMQTGDQYLSISGKRCAITLHIRAVGVDRLEVRVDIPTDVLFDYFLALQETVVPKQTTGSNISISVILQIRICCHVAVSNILIKPYDPQISFFSSARPCQAIN